MSGQKTALARLAPGQGRRYQLLGEDVTVKVAGADTGGAYTLIEVVSPPGGGPPGLHTHPAQETFYVLEGEFRFDGEAGGVAGPGAVVHIPHGAPHNYRNVGGRPGRYLALFEPAGFEEFVAELGSELKPGEAPRPPAGPPDREAAMAVMRKHGIEIVGAPH